VHTVHKYTHAVTLLSTASSVTLRCKLYKVYLKAARRVVMSLCDLILGTPVIGVVCVVGIICRIHTSEFNLRTRPSGILEDRRVLTEL
jgi:hypothetical protein